MIAHQQPSMHLPTMAFASTIQPIKKQQMIGIGVKQFFPAVATRHDVIERPWKNKAKLSSHWQTLSTPRPSTRKCYHARTHPEMRQ